MEVLNAFGLDWKVLLAQFFNFAILVFVLWRFAYKPILKFLDDRKNKIEEGIKNAEQASQKLVEIEEREKEVLVEARKEALKIINEAKDNAEKRGADIIVKAQEAASLAMSKEREKFNQEKGDIFKEMKGSLSELVILAVEKVIEEKMNSEKDREIIKKVLNS